MRTASGWAAFLPRTGENIIILEEFDFGFEKWEIEYIRDAWESGKEFEDIVKKLVRFETEILLALIHLANKGKITRPFAYRPKKKK